MRVDERLRSSLTTLLRRREVWQANSLFALRIATAALSYIIFAITARITDKATFNDFTLIYTIIHVLGPLASMGQGNVAFKYMPLLSPPESIKHLLVSLRIVGLGLLVIVPFSIALLYRLHGFGIVLSIAATIVIFGVNEVVNSARRVLGSVVKTTIEKDILWRVVVLVILVEMWLRGRTISLHGITLLYLLAFALSGIALGTPILRAARNLPAVAYQSRFSEWGFFMGLAAVDIAFWNVDIIVLNTMQIDAGGYFIAQRIAQMLYLVPASIGFIASPYISPAFQDGKLGVVERLSMMVSRYGGLTVAVGALLLMLIAPRVLQVFHARFVGDAYLLRILVLAPVVWSLGGLHSLVPSLCGQQRAYFGYRTLVMLLALGGKLYAAWYDNIGAVAWLTVMEVTCLTLVGILMSRRVGIRLGRVI